MGLRDRAVPTLVELCGRRSWAPTPLGTGSLAPILAWSSANLDERRLRACRFCKRFYKQTSARLERGRGQVSYVWMVPPTKKLGQQLSTFEFRIFSLAWVTRPFGPISSVQRHVPPSMDLSDQSEAVTGSCPCWWASRRGMTHPFIISSFVLIFSFYLDLVWQLWPFKQI